LEGAIRQSWRARRSPHLRHRVVPSAALLLVLLAVGLVPPSLDLLWIAGLYDAADTDDLVASAETGAPLTAAPVSGPLKSWSIVRPDQPGHHHPLGATDVLRVRPPPSRWRATDSASADSLTPTATSCARGRRERHHGNDLGRNSRLDVAGWADLARAIDSGRRAGHGGHPAGHR